MAVVTFQNPIFSFTCCRSESSYDTWVNEKLSTNPVAQANMQSGFVQKYFFEHL